MSPWIPSKGPLGTLQTNFNSVVRHLTGHFAAGQVEEQVSGDADDDEIMLGELPLEVLQHMFSLLDPLTLGNVSCVSRTWHRLSEDDSLWKNCLLQVALDSTAAQSKTGLTYRQQFTRLATSKLFAFLGCP